MKEGTIKRGLSWENVIRYAIVRGVIWSCWLALHIQFSMHRWNGRVALVTGASGGIGSNICKELIKHGMSVVGCDRDVENMQTVARDEYKSHGKLHAIKCDLTRESEILDMFNEIRQKFGRVDVCINNAGIITHSPLASAKTDEWEKILKVNVLALCICTRQSLALMKEKNIEDGQIINMGSLASHRLPVMPGSQFAFGMYSGTKAMIRTLAESLRQEMTTESLKDTKAKKPIIRISTICPGTVQTGVMPRLIGDEMAAKFFEQFECLQPKDIVDVVTYILSTPSHVNVEDVILQPMAYSL